MKGLYYLKTILSLRQPACLLAVKPKRLLFLIILFFCPARFLSILSRYGEPANYSSLRHLSARLLRAGQRQNTRHPSAKRFNGSRLRREASNDRRMERRRHHAHLASLSSATNPPQCGNAEPDKRGRPVHLP